MATKFTFYDEADCIGGNKILLEDAENTLFLDFGTNFKAESIFFDELLIPRSSFGFYDLLCLGILPPLKGIYRKDLEYSGIWEQFSSHPLFWEIEVAGVLISHAHVDHCGYLSYLREDMPIVTGPTSALISKTLQDIWGESRLWEIYCVTPRELCEGLLKATDYRRVPFR